MRIPQKRAPCVFTASTARAMAPIEALPSGQDCAVGTSTARWSSVPALPPRTNSVWSAFKARQMASERAGDTSDYRIDGVLCCGGSSRPAHVYPTRPAQPSQCAARPPAWGMMDVGRQVTSASSTFLTRLQKGRDHTPVIKRKLALKRRTHLSRLRVSCIVTCTRNNGRSLHRIINKQTP